MERSVLEELDLEKIAKVASESWDGIFWMESPSTGQYCRPSCDAWVKTGGASTPILNRDSLPQNTLEPCELCQPDKVNCSFGEEVLAAIRLKQTLRENLRTERTMARVAECTGLSELEMEQLCLRHYHKSTASLLDDERGKRAARLLGIETLSDEEVAIELGLRSVACLDEITVRHLGLTATDYRNLWQDRVYAITLPSGYRQDLVEPYWTRDPSDVTLQKRGEKYLRTFRLENQACMIEGSFGDGFFKVQRVDSLSSSHAFELHHQVLKTLGFASQPSEFQVTMRHQGLERLYQGREGLRITMTPTVFESLVWTILGQQINLAFAYKLRNRLIRETGERLGENLYAHPLPGEVARLDVDVLLQHQFSRRKVEYLLDISKRIKDGALPIEVLAQLPYPLMMKLLLTERGIGLWTARYVAMRGCGFGSCTPVGDAGLRKALKQFFNLEQNPDSGAMEDLMKQFSPYQSLATFHLWGMLS